MAVIPSGARDLANPISLEIPRSARNDKPDRQRNMSHDPKVRRIVWAITIVYIRTSFDLKQPCVQTVDRHTAPQHHRVFVPS